MSRVLLIYPYFRPRRDRSVFRFPPLGVAYVASSLLAAGHEVHLLDCTFTTRPEALRQALEAEAEVVGIYCMVTMLDDCLWLARQLRPHCRLLIAGGPLPSCDPGAFVADFDAVVIGEGEETVPQLITAHAAGTSFDSVAGLAYRARPGESGATAEELVRTPPRPHAADLDAIPSPARELLPNDEYIRHGRRRHGFSVTTVMASRGCPFRCEFCSNVLFGGSYRQRSAANVLDEVEEALALGYDRISFADDVFTMDRDWVLDLCAEVGRRGLHFAWECLGRVDTFDYALAVAMKRAGCARIFFGIESGDDDVLRLMNKRITVAQARAAVEAAHRAGLEVGAFFIAFYPGETQETVLRTLRLANALPLDYLGLTLPYPLPGTALHERMLSRMTRAWQPGESHLANQMVTFSGDFSPAKMWFGLAKGYAQFRLKRLLGRLAPPLLWPFERVTDVMFRWLK